jgi:hypothetical protein
MWRALRIILIVVVWAHTTVVFADSVHGFMASVAACKGVRGIWLPGVPQGTCGADDKRGQKPVFR